MQSFTHIVLNPCRGRRTLAEHGNVPVRCSVHDCAARGKPKHMQSCAAGALKSHTQVCHFFENFDDFSPVENFFELSTSYQQCAFFDAVF